MIPLHWAYDEAVEHVVEAVYLVVAEKERGWEGEEEKITPSKVSPSDLILPAKLHILKFLLLPKIAPPPGGQTFNI
jgi:hypothetical protein